MADNARQGFHIPLSIKKIKWGSKIEKNCNFLAKNASNHPKFGLEVYLGGLYIDFQSFENVCKKNTYFWQKNMHLFIFFFYFSAIKVGI